MKYDFNIVTIHEAVNFGAALQAYALKTYIGKIGYKVGIYNSQTIAAPMDRSIKTFIIKLVSALNAFMNAKHRKCKKAKFKKFAEDYFELNRNDAQVYIAGSDQIWNPIVFNPDYYLRFVEHGSVKASYAASIGVNKIPEEKYGIYQASLNDFSRISVRESNAKQELQRILGDKKDIRVHLDPVFLLTKEEWLSIAEKNNVEMPEKYIFIYVLHRPKNLAQLCRWLKKETGYALVLADISGFDGLTVPHDVLLKDVGPRNFISLVSNAEIVVTTSFHGTAFSILFEKEFYSVINPAFPSRVQNVMDHFKLNAVRESDTSFSRIEQSYKTASELISENRRCSREYFDELIRMCEC